MKQRTNLKSVVLTKKWEIEKVDKIFKFILENENVKEIIIFYESEKKENE